MKYQRIIFVIIFSSLLFGQGRSLPAFFYGSTTTAYITDNDSIQYVLLKTARRLPDDTQLISGTKKAFILICEGVLLELQPESKVTINRSEKTLRLQYGNLMLHYDNYSEPFYYNIVIDDGTISNMSSDDIKIMINYKEHQLNKEQYFPLSTNRILDSRSLKQSRRDGRYVLGMIYQSDISTMQGTFYLPSERPRGIDFSTREKTGTASYRSDTYYHAGTYLRLMYQELELVYNIWLGLSLEKGFYKNNWDEWQDIFHNIHYMQLFHPTDPFYLRLGVIENLEFGRGYLMNNYNNTVILPFESLSGVQIKANAWNISTKIFVNDITKPRIGGIFYSWRQSRKLHMDLTYIGDIDQYSNIADNDRDSYPDKVDPEPETKNTAEDSIIVADNPISLDDIDERQLHAIAMGLKYQLGTLGGNDIFITGDFAMLSALGVGVSFPNLFIGKRLMHFGIGADFQSPNFSSSIFDRSYEYNKARFITNEAGEYELISRARTISDATDWYYGWNMYFNFVIPKKLSFVSRYRDVQNGNEHNKHLSISLRSYYSFTEYLRNYSFFIDHKNIDKIFKERTDGQIWGFKISTQPHVAIKVNVRYRQQIRDADGDNIITDDDIVRNFSLGIILDSNYWWKKWKERRERKRGG